LTSIAFAASLPINASTSTLWDLRHPKKAGTRTGARQVLVTSDWENKENKMSYSQQELDAFWNRYVTMNESDVVSLTNSSSAAYEPVFAAMLAFCFQNQLYGFGNPRTPWDGTGSSGPGWGGPTRS
jgi:hypothetical protein